MIAPRLLLISNSTLHGSGYLDHCAEAMRAFLGPDVKRVLFVPFAAHDLDAYHLKVRERLARLGLECEALHQASDPTRAVEGAESVFVGGGNTFRLLAGLETRALLEPLRQRVAGGMPYMGSSAGSGVACVSIRTTNDMPIVEPRSFTALGLVPFNINAHYQDPSPGSTHMGETREQRIHEFHEENTPPVVGLREGAWLHVEGRSVKLGGRHGARLFRRGRAPEESATGAQLDFLMRP